MKYFFRPFILSLRRPNYEVVGSLAELKNSVFFHLSAGFTLCSHCSPVTTDGPPRIGGRLDEKAGVTHRRKLRRHLLARFDVAQECSGGAYHT